MEELRKHYSTMSGLEIWYLENIINQMGEYKISNHAKSRMKQKKISNKNIHRALKDFKIIEYHRKNGEDRVLIRSNQGEFCICLVISINNSRIITAYKNDSTDNHYTIKWEEYSNFNILDYIEPKIKYNYERKMCYEA